MIAHEPILVTHDDVRSGVLDLSLDVKDLEAFCRSIQIGDIKNVRLRCRTCGQAIVKKP